MWTLPTCVDKKRDLDYNVIGGAKMKRRRVFMVLFSTILFFSSVIFAGCATAPPVKQDSPKSFMGNWVGIWRDYSGPSGEVNTTITPLPDSRLLIAVLLTNSRNSSWSIKEEFKDGGLVFNSSTLQMDFWINKDGLLEATYNYQGNKGSWLLKKN